MLYLSYLIRAIIVVTLILFAVLTILGLVAWPITVMAAMVGVTIIFLLMRTMGWISFFMMHMGPGDKGTETYEPVMIRVAYTGFIAVSAAGLLLAVHSPTNALTAIAIAAFAFCIPVLMPASLLVKGPYGFLRSLIGVVVAIAAVTSALVFRGTYTSLIAWGIFGAAVGFASPRVLSDDELKSHGKSWGW